MSTCGLTTFLKFVVDRPLAAYTPLEMWDDGPDVDRLGPAIVDRPLTAYIPLEMWDDRPDVDRLGPDMDRPSCTGL